MEYEKDIVLGMKDLLEMIGRAAANAIKFKIRTGLGDKIDKILNEVPEEAEVLCPMLEELTWEIDFLVDEYNVISDCGSDGYGYDADEDDREIERIEYEIAELKEVVYKVQAILDTIFD